MTIRRIGIWIKMLFGKSELHISQPVGAFFSNTKIAGYYNDLSGKVLCDKKHFNDQSYIPSFKNDYGDTVYFPVTIAQYGLGCYELFLKNKDNHYLSKAKACADYLISQIKDDGSVSCMFFVRGLKNPYSSMCQGECASLFVRIYESTKDEKYINSLKMVINFLIDENSEMKVLEKVNDKYRFYEYPDKPAVLNGWIFSLFGLYDAWLILNDQKYFEVFQKSSLLLLDEMSSFTMENGWSYYDQGKAIASKFYHELHINLLTALQSVSGLDFMIYINLYKASLKNKKTCKKMFWKKAGQKVRGK